jgi:hypothetical protein
MYQKVVNYFNGKKTIIGIIAGALYIVAIHFSIAPSSDLVWTGIATWTGVSFKLGLNNLLITTPQSTISQAELPPAQKYIPPGGIVEPPEVLAG